MAFYGDKTKAANLAGVDVAEATETKLDLINAYIDTEIKWGGFGSEDADEYYDILKDNQKEIVLKNHPVVSVSEVYNEASSDDPKLLSENNYVIDEESGVLQIINTKTILSNGISSFAKGFDTVRVKYSYGFAEVPDIIVNLATYLLARYLKLEDMFGNAGIIKSVKIGNYSESYNTNLQTPWDRQLMRMEDNIKLYYAEGV